MYRRALFERATCVGRRPHLAATPRYYSASRRIRSPQYCRHWETNMEERAVLPIWTLNRDGSDRPAQAEKVEAGRSKKALCAARASKCNEEGLQSAGRDRGEASARKGRVRAFRGRT